MWLDEDLLDAGANNAEKPRAKTDEVFAQKNNELSARGYKVVDLSRRVSSSPHMSEVCTTSEDTIDPYLFDLRCVGREIENILRHVRSTVCYEYDTSLRLLGRITPRFSQDDTHKAD